MKRIFLSLLILAALSGFAYSKKPARKFRQAKTIDNKINLKDSPLKILYKPRAAYPTQEKGTICVTGTVALRVQFLESGKIGEVVVVSGLPYGLTESAVEAAKKIKFKPARKNGETVTISKVVTFLFSLY